MLATSAALPALVPDWLDAGTMIEAFVDWLGPFAILGVCVVVFAETGLLVGFFLPGDSLLFTLGMFTGLKTIDTPLWVVLLSVFVAAFVGDQVGYVIGRKSGPRIFEKPDSRLFKKQHVDRTNAFFDKYGGRTIILARFVPIVRTFAPVAAGVGKMSYRHFVSFNVIGAFLWGVGVTLLGVWLGKISFVREFIEPILVGIVLISVVPILLHLARPYLARMRTEQELRRRIYRSLLWIVPVIAVLGALVLVSALQPWGSVAALVIVVVGVVVGVIRFFRGPQAGTVQSFSDTNVPSTDGFAD